MTIEFANLPPQPGDPAENTQSRSNRSWGRILIWVALFVLLFVVGISLYRTQQGPVNIGSRAPDFSLTTFDGQNIELATLKGKVVVVNFWASWCTPCEAEAADMETAWRYYQPGGEVVFIGIAWTDTEPNSKKYLEHFDITYPNGPDLRTRISQAYRTTGVPETYVIDRNGLIAYIKLSPFTSLAEIKTVIDPLLVE